MPWVRFDDQFPIHRKVEGLTDAAFRLHISAIFWCSRNLTDGHISAQDIESATPRRMRRPGRFIAELVGRGLWIEVDDGWLIHDYLDFQPSREKVERERKAKAERQARWLDKRRKTSRTDSPVDIDASGDASQDGSKDDAPYPPRPEGGGGGDAPAAPGAAGRAERKRPAVRAVPDWCGECDERTRQIDPDRPRRCPNCHPLRDEDTA